MRNSVYSIERNINKIFENKGIVGSVAEKALNN